VIPVRVVLSERWPVPPVGSRLESRSAALGGSLGAATTRLLSVVAPLPLLALCSCEWFVLLSCACACDLFIF